MDKAEERALKCYPSLTDPFDRSKRLAYRNGYHQAEKDLALTWGDVQLLDSIVLELVREECNSDKDYGDGEAFYSEVLRRFNETKK